MIEFLQFGSSGPKFLPGDRVTCLRSLVDLNPRFRSPGQVLQIWGLDSSPGFYRLVPVLHGVYPPGFDPWSQVWGRTVHELDLEKAPEASGACFEADNWSWVPEAVSYREGDRVLLPEQEIEYSGPRASVVRSRASGEIQDLIVNRYPESLR